ncbi:MAG: hypothetical protein IPN25_09530 [Sphingobacteriales bacterium]|nr:hypothetical protein [Sphingobacteriales bacterium]
MLPIVNLPPLTITIFSGGELLPLLHPDNKTFRKRQLTKRHPDKMALRRRIKIE